jgi:hypothetical protein
MRARSDLWAWRSAAVAISTVDPTINDAARMDRTVFRIVGSFKLVTNDQTQTPGASSFRSLMRIVFG